MPRPKRARGRPADPNAQYLATADRLRTWLAESALAIGGVIPSVRALAKRFRVGVNTARRALDILKLEGRLGVSARRRLVLLYPGRPYMAMRDLVLEVLDTSLEKMLNISYNVEIQHGIELGVGSRYWPLVIAHAESFGQTVPKDFLSLPLRGILLWGTFIPETLLQYERLNVPVVLVDQPQQRGRIHSVAVDNVAAAFDATTRLLNLGHRRIAFVRFIQLDIHSVDPDSQERQEGFERAFQEAGVPLRKGYLCNAFPKDTPESANVRAVVARANGCTAVLAVDPTRSKLVLEAARLVGRAVPRDLSVVGFRGRQTPFRLSGPRPNFEAIGRQAVSLLEGPKEPRRAIRVPTVWVDEGTVGPVFR